MNQNHLVDLIPLNSNNINIIKDVVISPEQAAYENQTESHAETLLNPILGRTVLPFALESQQLIIGCFRLIISPEEDLCSLSAFAISAPFQRKGYGERSLGSIVDYVYRSYPKTIFLGLAVNSRNYAARKLYEKCGFKYYGSFENYGDTYRLIFDREKNSK